MISFFSFFVKLYLCYHNLFIWTFKKGLEFSFSAVDLLSSWPEKSALPTGRIDLILLNSHLPKRSKYLKMEIEILPSYEIQENQNSDTFCRYADLPNAHSWFCLLLQQHAFSSLSSYFLKSKTKSFLVLLLVSELLTFGKGNIKVDCWFGNGRCIWSSQHRAHWTEVKLV